MKSGIIEKGKDPVPARAEPIECLVFPAQSEDYPSSWHEAVARNLPHYNAMKSCKRGHGRMREVTTKRCPLCRILDNREYHEMVRAEKKGANRNTREHMVMQHVDYRQHDYGELRL